MKIGDRVRFILQKGHRNRWGWAFGSSHDFFGSTGVITKLPYEGDWERHKVMWLGVQFHEDTAAAKYYGNYSVDLFACDFELIDAPFAAVVEFSTVDEAIAAAEIIAKTLNHHVTTERRS